MRDAAQEMGVSARQARRRLERRNGQAPYTGKLLRWRDQPGGVREVNPAVLRQMMEAEPVDIERALSEVHDRVDVLDRRTLAHRRQLVSQRKAIEGIQKSQAALIGSVSALSGHREKRIVGHRRPESVKKCQGDKGGHDRTSGRDGDPEVQV
jgi:hypothetical protein